jgi:CRP/FNR family cyclic AMP-dependent transcriptional regulator
MPSPITKKVYEYFSQYTLRRYRKGQIFIFPGEKAAFVYCLKSGTVKQYAYSYRSDKVVVNVFDPPAYFPLTPLVAGLPIRYFFEAETSVEMYQAPAKETLKFFKSDAEVLFHIVSMVYASVDVVLGRMVQLMTGTAKTRVVYELLTECKKFDHRHGGAHSATVHLNEKDLSARTGLSRETINRQLQKLKALDLIEAKRGSITVSDIEKLEKQLSNGR